MDVQKEALDEIARIAYERETGARGLRAVLEMIMLDIMYSIPSEQGITKVVISPNMVLGKQKAKILYSNKEKSA